MRRSILLAPMAVLSVFAFATTAGAGEALTEKQFLKQANATCEDAYQEIDAALEDQFADLGENEEPSAAQIEAAVASIVEILRTAAADVKALVGPPALERKVKRFLGEFRAVVAGFEDDPEGAFEAELSGYPFAKPDRLARKIGLTGCVQRGD